MKSIRILAAAAMCLLASAAFGQTATATHSSATVVVSVTAAPTAAAVTVSAAPNPTAGAASVVVTANVASPTTGGTVPSGTVNFYNGSPTTGTLIATSALTNGTATCTLSTAGVAAPSSITVTAQFISSNSLYF